MKHSIVVALVSTDMALNEARIFAAAEERHGGYEPVVVRIRDYTYAVARKLTEEEAIAWLVEDPLSAKHRILHIDPSSVILEKR